MIDLAPEQGHGVSRCSLEFPTPFSRLEDLTQQFRLEIFVILLFPAREIGRGEKKTKKRVLSTRGLPRGMDKQRSNPRPIDLGLHRHSLEDREQC